jgi:hypothetical protein
VHLRRVEGSCALLSLLDGQFLTLIITEVESVFQFLREATVDIVGDCRANSI